MPEMRKISLLSTGFLALLVMSWPVCAQILQKEGIHKTYYKTGELQFESKYRNGKLQGKTREFAKDGTLIAEYLYENDELVGQIEVPKRRDYGPFTIFMTWQFWLILILFLAGLWFIFAKIFFKGRPY
jgi:hypothetical protein